MSEAIDAANSLFEEYRGRPVGAVQVSPENAQTLAALDGVALFEGEETYWLTVQTAYGTEHARAGDWLVESTLPGGRWLVYAGPNGDAMIRFDETFEIGRHEKVEAALRQLISDLDYDLDKQLECDEETGEDHYPGLAEEFIEYYDAEGEN